MSWQVPPPNWNSVAGQVLDAFLAEVASAMPDYSQALTVLGSTPIQMCLDEAFLSADIDVMVLNDDAVLRPIASSIRLKSERNIRPAFGIQICPSSMFQPTPHYLQRAHVETRHGLRVIIPHVRDILVAKLHRSRYPEQEGLVPKDDRAFARVRELCDGHPTRGDMLEDFIACEPRFRVPLDGSVNYFHLNAQELFLQHYGRPLDIENEIVRPARDLEGGISKAYDMEVRDALNSLRPSRP